MLTSRSFGVKAVVGAALVLLIGLVGTAEARKFAMSGKWVQRRGVVYIPVAPGSNGIPAVDDAYAEVQARIPGGPASMKIKPSQFYLPEVYIAFPLPQPTLVQISSHFTAKGPKSTGFFQPGHWVGTRPFKDFCFCPGTPVKPAVGATKNGYPGCAVPQSEGQTAPAGSGKAHGRVCYTAGANAYGGTMQMVMGKGGVISFRIGVTGPTLMHNPFGGAIGAAPTEGPGGSYANTSLTDVLPGGPITVGPVLSPGGMVQTPGVRATYNGYNLYGTTATWFVWGFPWTTGTVLVSGTQAGPYTSTIVTQVGTDNRTSLGAGNITLVAGGIANGLHSGFTYMSFDYVTMTLSGPVPSMSPAGIAAGALLMVLAVGYALRRRF